MEGKSVQGNDGESIGCYIYKSDVVANPNFIERVDYVKMACLLGGTDEDGVQGFGLQQMKSIY